MSTTQTPTPTVCKAQPLPARSLHWIVFVFFAAFGAICVTFPLAMLRVSGMEKFRGFHVKSLPVGERIVAENGNLQQPSPQPTAASSESQKMSDRVANAQTSTTPNFVVNPEIKAIKNSDNIPIQSETVSFETRLKSEDCAMAQPFSDDLTYVRSQPDADADIILGIPEGHPMVMLSNKDVFVEVELPDGTQGWIYDDRWVSCDNFEQS